MKELFGTLSSQLGWVKTKKSLVLILLCVQTTTYIMLVRYSRGVRHETYNQSVTVLMIEITKFSAFLCGICLFL